MSTKTDSVINLVKAELKDTQKYFDISVGEILVDEDQYFSMTVAIQPKAFSNGEVEVVGEKQLLQFDIDDEGDITLIIGEDTELGVTIGSIYSVLYWSTVTKPIKD